MEPTRRATQARTDERAAALRPAAPTAGERACARVVAAGQCDRGGRCLHCAPGRCHAASRHPPGAASWGSKGAGAFEAIISPSQTPQPERQVLFVTSEPTPTSTPRRCRTGTHVQNACVRGRTRPGRPASGQTPCVTERPAHRADACTARAWTQLRGNPHRAHWCGRETGSPLALGQPGPKPGAIRGDHLVHAPRPRPRPRPRPPVPPASECNSAATPDHEPPRPCVSSAPIDSLHPCTRTRLHRGGPRSTATLCCTPPTGVQHMHYPTRH
jgi:hypothetical protein